MLGHSARGTNLGPRQELFEDLKKEKRQLDPAIAALERSTFLGLLPRKRAAPLSEQPPPSIKLGGISQERS
jgi:hypothetical protein